MYDYRVRSILRVVDGDTVDTVLDLGFGLTARVRVRVTDPAGVYVDTPERADRAAWQTATDLTRAWFAAHVDGLTCATQKAGPSSTGIGDGAFGRWLGDFYQQDRPGSLAAELIAAGYTRPAA